jgi:hypothetical protein
LEILHEKEEFMKPRSEQFRKVSIPATVRPGLGASVPTARAGAETIVGEVVDVICYPDHGAKSAERAGCARAHIESARMLGILTKDNQLLLLVGEHKPMNDKLSPLAAKAVTLKGNIVERNGIMMIEDAEIEEQPRTEREPLAPQAESQVIRARRDGKLHPRR